MPAFALLLVIVAASSACGSSQPRSSSSSSSSRSDNANPGGANEGNAPSNPIGTSDGTNDPGTSATPAPQVTLSQETIAVDGQQRSYMLAVPQSYDVGRHYPLVLVFHGDGGNGPSMRAALTFESGSGDEAIVAYPTGTNAAWDLNTPLATNADMRFVQELATTLSAKYTIDGARVFGVGYSKGAFFINQMACRVSGFFRGLVSFDGGAPNESYGDPAASAWPSGVTKCVGQTGGVAAMIVHGDADTVVTPDSGDFNAAYWATVNGCQESRVDTTPAPCKRNEGCPTDKPVLFCLIPKLDHVVWGEGAKEGWAFMKGL